MTVWKWSQTPATNNTADSTINFREGQSPGTLNNSSRGIMAAVRKFWDDISGNLVTGGTLTAYTVTTNQVITALSSLTDGFSFWARMHATSGAAPTMAVDSQTAKQIRGVYGTNLATGALLLNGVYKFTYDSTDDAWIVGGRFGDTLTSGSNAGLVAIQALAGTTGVLRKTAADVYSLDDGTTALIFEKDGNGSVLATGIQGDSQVPFACTITGITVLADQSGSLVLDVWKDTYANYPPTVADTITAAAKPTLSTATKTTDTTLTGWTTALAAGDTIRFNLDSITTITRMTVILKVKRFI